MARYSAASARRVTGSRSSAASTRWTAGRPTNSTSPRSPPGACRRSACARPPAPRAAESKEAIMGAHFSFRRLGSALFAVAAIALGTGLGAQSTPEINFDANADILSLPSYGEVAGVATNSKGHVFVYARTGHAVATLGDERTFYHGGSRLFQFDQNGKYVREIGQGAYSVHLPHQVRGDPQDNVWIVDAGSNMVTKFDADGRLLMVLGRKPENISVRPGPGVPGSGGAAAGGVAPEAGRGGGPGGGRGNAAAGSGINDDSFSQP